MNRFNKKGRNNVKLKHKAKAQKRRDKVEGKERQLGTYVPKSEKKIVQRLSVSGARTGKHRAKIVKKWRKTQGAAALLESGAVTMEDVVMLAGDAPSRSSEQPPKDEDAMQEAGGAPGCGGGGRTLQRQQQLGIRVKPSKKARLRLKKKKKQGAMASTPVASEAMME